MRFNPVMGGMYKEDCIDRYCRKYAQAYEGSVVRALG